MNATHNIVLEVCVGLTKDANMFVRNFIPKFGLFCLNGLIVSVCSHNVGVLGAFFSGFSLIGLAIGALVGTTLGLVFVHMMDLDLKHAYELLEKELTHEEQIVFLVYVMQFFDQRELVDSETTLRDLKEKPNLRYQILHRIAMFLSLELNCKVYITHEGRKVLF